MSKTLLLQFTLIFIILSTMTPVSVSTILNNDATPKDNLAPLLDAMTIDPTLPRVVPPNPTTPLMIQIVEEPGDPLTAIEVLPPLIKFPHPTPSPERTNSAFAHMLQAGKNLAQKLSTPFFAQRPPTEEVTFDGPEASKLNQISPLRGSQTSNPTLVAAV